MKQKVVAFTKVSLLIIISACSDSSNNAIIPSGKIFIDSEPQGAGIWLDDLSTNTFTPATIEAEAGTRKLTLKLDGYPDLSFSTIVIADQQLDLDQNNLIYPGRLNITSVPQGALIYMNGRETRKVTPSSFSVEDDTYFIFLRLENYSDTTYVTLISEGSTQNVDIVLEPL